MPLEPRLYLLGYAATKQLRDLDCLQNKAAAVSLVMGVTLFEKNQISYLFISGRTYSTIFFTIQHNK